MYLFSYFINQGEDGLHLARSTDGFSWVPVLDGRPLLNPSVGGGVMRDPAIAPGPDGVFHLTWTTGWFDRGIGLAHSRDLRTWTEPEFVQVMNDEPAALNCWAPEIFYEDASREFIVYWSSTVPGRFAETDLTGDLHDGHRLNHRIYFVRTRDFVTFSRAALLFDGGFNAIDATLFRAGGRYMLVVKDETRHPSPCKRLHLASSPALTGPWLVSHVPISPDWVEGPSVLGLDGGWMIYYDEYTRGRYGAVWSRDLDDWTVISSRLVFPPGARHGSAFPVPRGSERALAAAGILPSA